MLDEPETSLLDVEGFVHCYGLPKKDGSVWRHLVDVNLVYECLTWLINNNKHYKSVQLPAKPDDLFPLGLFDDEKDIDLATATCAVCNSTDFDSIDAFLKHQRACADDFVSSLEDAVTQSTLPPADVLSKHRGKLCKLHRTSNNSVNDGRTRCQKCSEILYDEDHKVTCNADACLNMVHNNPQCSGFEDALDASDEWMCDIHDDMMDSSCGSEHNSVSECPLCMNVDNNDKISTAFSSDDDDDYIHNSWLVHSDESQQSLSDSDISNTIVAAGGLTSTDEDSTNDVSSTFSGGAGRYFMRKRAESTDDSTDEASSSDTSTDNESQIPSGVSSSTVAQNSSIDLQQITNIYNDDVLTQVAMENHKQCSDKIGNENSFIDLQQVTSMHNAGELDTDGSQASKHSNRKASADDLKSSCLTNSSVNLQDITDMYNANQMDTDVSQVIISPSCSMTSNITHASLIVNENEANVLTPKVEMENQKQSSDKKGNENNSSIDLQQVTSNAGEVDTDGSQAIFSPSSSVASNITDSKQSNKKASADDLKSSCLTTSSLDIQDITDMYNANQMDTDVSQVIISPSCSMTSNITHASLIVNENEANVLTPKVEMENQKQSSDKKGNENNSSIDLQQVTSNAGEVDTDGSQAIFSPSSSVASNITDSKQSNKKASADDLKSSCLTTSSLDIQDITDMYNANQMDTDVSQVIVSPSSSMASNITDASLIVNENEDSLKSSNSVIENGSIVIAPQATESDDRVINGPYSADIHEITNVANADIMQQSKCSEDAAADDGNNDEKQVTADTESNEDDNLVREGQPWVERISRDALNDEFGHLTVIGVDGPSGHENVKDIFKTIRLDDTPVPSHLPYLDAKAFFDVFPHGFGCMADALANNVTASVFEKAKLMTADGFVRRNQQYLFHLAQQRELRDIRSGIARSLNSSGMNILDKEDLLKKYESKDDDSLRKKVSCVLNKLPSSTSFWKSATAKVKAMVKAYGPPTWWLTLSPGDYDDDDMLEYLREVNSDLPGVHKMTVSQLICKDPVLACTYLQSKFDATFDYIRSEAEPLGKVIHDVVRTEYQTRLMPHYHCILWVENAPVIGVNSSQEVMDFVAKYSTCKLPNVHDDKAAHDRVKKFQLHKCNKYCLRKKQGRKAVCKFGFPRPVRSQPVLHDVMESIVSRKSGSCKKRLYELERRPTEQRINDYPPLIHHMWKGNIDLQFIGEDSESLIDYITKYATKGPTSNLDDIQISNMMSDKSAFSKLLSMSLKLSSKREMGSMEARNYLMGEAALKTDTQFQFINNRFPCHRKRMLKTGNALKALPSGSKDIFWGNFESVWYPSRPVE